MKRKTEKIIDEIDIYLYLLYRYETEYGYILKGDVKFEKQRENNIYNL